MKKKEQIKGKRKRKGGDTGKAIEHVFVGVVGGGGGGGGGEQR